VYNYKLQAVVSFVERASGHLEVIYAFINEARQSKNAHFTM